MIKNRLEMEALIQERRKLPGRNFEKGHSMDECLERYEEREREEQVVKVVIVHEDHRLQRFRW